MKAIKDIRKAHRMRSVQAVIITALFNTASIAWTAFVGTMPVIWWASVNLVLSIATLVARLVYQPELNGANNGDDE